MTLKLRVPVPFPANVTGSGGIKVTKAAGEWTIEPDFSAISTIGASSLADPTSKEIWVFDPVTLSYNVMTLADLGDALYSATSTTSLSLGVGAKTFVTQSGKDFAVGSWGISYSAADPTKYMIWQVTTYTGTSLVVNTTAFGGSGTVTDWVIRASSPPGAAGKSAGHSYVWNTATSGDPGSGKILGNNATITSITAINISETDSDGNSIASNIASWDDSTSTIHGRLKIYDPVTPTNYAYFDVTGANVDAGTYDTLTVSYVGSGGTLTNALAIYVLFIPKGDKGDVGLTGASSGFIQAYDTTTTDSDPGNGVFRLNNATPASATAAYLDNLDASAATVSGLIDTWDDSTNTVKGTLNIVKAGAPGTWATFQVTGSIVDGTGYRKLTLQNGTGSGAFTAADQFSIAFLRAGDKGADGLGTGDVVGPSSSVDSEIALFNSTTGKLIKRASLTGIVKATAGVASAATDGTDILSSTTGVKQGKQTIFVPAHAMVSRTTNGAVFGTVEQATNKNMVRSLDFDTTTQQFAQFSVWFPKSWDLGTVTFQPSFSQLTTAAGGVVFGLAAVAVSDGDSLDAAFGTAQTSTKTAGTANIEYQGPESSAITIAGTPAAGDRILFQVNRTVADGGDTLAQNARLHGIRLFFNTNAATDA